MTRDQRPEDGARGQEPELLPEEQGEEAQRLKKRQERINFLLNSGMTDLERYGLKHYVIQAELRWMSIRVVNYLYANTGGTDRLPKEQKIRKLMMEQYLCGSPEALKRSLRDPGPGMVERLHELYEGVFSEEAGSV